ncbi:SUKH-3 domain-containing protein [Streptomyces sp. NPDC096105]|uniref:SUKH-3 domain-containing protein n=1 Tax=Streptomyces sp. NPDC096105 TaxID=3366074 RepID=UPI00381B706F
MSDSPARAWSPQTDAVLRRAGWRPGRFVRTGTWEAVVPERGGCAVHDAARRFLAEFGGLVTYGWPAGPVTTWSAVRFDPLVAAWHRERLGSGLCPVGTADQGAGLLGIDEDGVLHLVRDRVEPLGATLGQALDRLIATQRTRARLWKSRGPADAHPFWKRVRALPLLEAAGWCPGRSVPTDTWEDVLRTTGEFEPHDAARRFLAEFGALAVPHRDPADSMPWVEFSLDPLAAMWDAEIIDDLAEQAGAELYPIGTRDRGNQYLAMAEDGAVYAGMDHVHLLASTPDEALRRLTARVRPEAAP